MAKGALILVAAFGMTAFAAGSGFLLAAQAYDQDEERIGGPSDPGERRREPQQSDTDRGGVPRPIERLISNPEPGDGTEREKRDLAAQENTAAWAFWMVVLSFAQALLSAAGIFFIVKTLRHSQHVAYHELRAYVSFGTGKIIELGDQRWSVRVPILNTGQTPATEISIKAFGFFADYPLQKKAIRQIWEKLPLQAMDSIGPNSERARRFVFLLPDSTRAAIKSGTLCIFLRIQVSYTTYSGQRVDEPASEWMVREEEFAGQTAVRPTEDHYEQEDPTQPNLL